MRLVNRAMSFRGFALGAMVIGSLSLIGCLDIVHHVTRDDSGDTVVHARLVFSRLLLEMAEEGDVGVENQCASLEDVAVEMTSQDVAGASYRVELVDTELECGLSIRYAGSDELISLMAGVDDDFPVVPLLDSDRITVRFPDQELELDDDGYAGGVVLAIMSSAKYRLRVSKAYFPTIERAVFQTDDGSVELDVQDYEDIFEIELPINYWMAAHGESLLIVDR